MEMPVAKASTMLEMLANKKTLGKMNNVVKLTVNT